MRLHAALALALLALALGGAPLAAEPARLSLQLAQVESEAVKSSSGLKAVRAEKLSAESREDAAWTALWPRLSLDGNYRYNTMVPEFQLVPRGPVVKFGDHQNYSAGATANWTFWDSLAGWDTAHAAKALARSKGAEAEARERAVRLQARAAYFSAMLAAERSRLVADSLKLAQSQSADIELRLKAGASSRLDALSAKSEVLTRRDQYRQARVDLAGALRDLFALTGLGAETDPSVPMDASTAKAPPSDCEPASLVLDLESLESALQALKGAEDAGLSERHPQLRVLAEMAEASRLQASALRSGHWPRLSASARSSYDYPNGPVLEQVQQNSFSVQGTWPLFAFGQISRQSAEQEALAEAAEARRKAADSDLKRDWLKAQDRLKGLRDRKGVDAQAVEENETFSRMVYSAYQNGSSSLLEAQSASLKLLESKVRLATTETQMLIELAILASLTE